jgi:Xaa-Pro aminopeptidase
MKEEGIDCYVITKNDPHQSEYVPKHFNAVYFMSSFSGSYGYLIVTEFKCALFTDGRYTLQASLELDGLNIDIHSINDSNFYTYIADMTPVDGAIGFDGMSLSMHEFNIICKMLKSKNISFKTDGDALAQVFNKKPPLPRAKIFEHDDRYAGCPRAEKMAELREMMKERDIDTYIISSLDDIAYLFNLRSQGINNSTTFPSYAVISQETVSLCANIDPESKLAMKLIEDRVSLYNYTDVLKIKVSGNIGLSPKKTSCSLYLSLAKTYNIIPIDIDLTSLMKSIKTPKEIDNILQTNIKDGIAMIKFIMWLKKHIGNITEYDVAKKLYELRNLNEEFIGTSFDTIASFNENGAIVHYTPKKGLSKRIEKNGVLLVDSGGNYLGGTTDITRTFPTGYINKETKKDMTLVLKAHISLARAVFLYGTTGHNIDILARNIIWQNHINYNTGTGHGVGYCLNVHEGPQKISMTGNDIPLSPGMVVTNEPGIYKQDCYGIRIENMLLVEIDTNNEYGLFLKFTPLTYCPIDLEGIEQNLLNNEEKSWLNEYHSLVYNKLSPHLSEDEADWLAKECHAI